jgi:hypothetical protein
LFCTFCIGGIGHLKHVKKNGELTIAPKSRRGRRVPIGWKKVFGLNVEILLSLERPKVFIRTEGETLEIHSGEGAQVLGRQVKHNLKHNFGTVKNC